MDLSQYKIMCVDDEKDVLMLRSDFVLDLGFTPILATNVEEAIAHLNNCGEEIIFILSDYEMPGTKGLEFRRMIFDDFSQIPFAIISGYLTKEMALEGIDLKICAFLDKPEDEEVLKQLINKETSAFIEEKEEELELIEGFIDDTKGLLADIEEIILQLETEPTELSNIDDLMRLLHTIKGTGSCVGLKVLSKFAHKFEDLATEIKKGERQVTVDLINGFLKAYDYLKFLMENAVESEKIDISENLKLLDISKTNNDVQTAESLDVNTELQASGGKKSKDSLVKKEEISVGIDILDSFMELSGNLTVSRNTAVKMINNIQIEFTNNKSIESLSTALNEMNKVSTQMQNLIVETRKVSLRNVYKPLPRIVRDVTRDTGKKATLLFEGDELRVDNSIAKVLTNSLVHMVRNSVDHAIESPEDRASGKKVEQGKIKICSYEEGENVVVEVSDDGKGISTELIKNKLISNGAFSEAEISEMSKRKLLSMIFHPGFSTAAAVTDISGRGVGMDMVMTSVKKLGGQIITESKVGFGTSFKMILPKPKSVLILDSLFVTVSDKKFAIPQDEIDRVIHLDEKVKKNLRYANNKMFLKYEDDKLLPVIHIDEILGLNKVGKDKKDLKNVTSLIVLRHDETQCVVLINEILDVEEIVVKKLQHSLRDLEVFLGVTYGEGDDLYLVLSTKGLLEAAQISLDEDTVDEGEDEVLEVANYTDFIEVGLNSEANYMLPLSQVYRLENIKKENIQYSVGAPILSYKENTLHLYCLVDLVDGGNGLSLPNNLSGEFKVIVFYLQDIFVGFVVPDILDINKVYDEINDGLSDNKSILGAIRFNERIINIINIFHLFDVIGLHRKKTIKEAELDISQAA
jgi:two-component system, chemotaxis family, sensor kinase CheA